MIIGGSLGGLFAVNILLRQGHHVLILEKTIGLWDGRGAGIVTHVSMVEVLTTAGVAVDLSKGLSFLSLKSLTWMAVLQVKWS